MEGKAAPKPPACPAGARSTRPEAPKEAGNARSRAQEAELRGPAQLSQQRRLRQATQFLHKDSADLLPLDSLKRLGTSKDWVRQPCPLPTPGSPDPSSPPPGKDRPQASRCASRPPLGRGSPNLWVHLNQSQALHWGYSQGSVTLGTLSHCSAP